MSRVVSPQTVELTHLGGTQAFADPVSVAELTVRTPRRPTLGLPEEMGTRILGDSLGDGMEDAREKAGPRLGWGTLSCGCSFAYLSKGR